MTVQRVPATTGSGPTVFGNLSDTIEAIWDGTVVKLTDTAESSGTYTCTWPNVAIPTSYADGMPIVVTWDATNDGTAQLAITSGPGTKAIVDAAGDALTGGELVAGTSSLLVFHGDTDDHWRVIGSGASSGGTSQSYPLVKIAVFTATGAATWTPPYTCDALIIAIGGGGSGGNYVNSGARSGGGGAGALVRKMVRSALATTPLTINVGAGGALATGNSSGNPGGTTTVSNVDLGVSINAGGGSGGGASTSGTAAGGAGGTGTGGDVNEGGAGGDATASTSGAGGGAVGLIGDGTPAVTVSTSVGGDGAHALTSPVVIPGFLCGLNGGGAGGTNAAGAAGAAFSGGGGSGGVSDPVGGAGGTGGGGGGAGHPSGALGSGAGGNGMVIIMYSLEIV